MNPQDIWALSPYIAMMVASVAVMLAIAIRRLYAASFVLTMIGLGAALALTFAVQPDAPRDVTPLLVIDSYSRFFAALIISAAMAVALFSYAYFPRREHYPDEFYILLLIATLGAAIMPASRHFISLYLGLEMLSVSLYALIAYTRTSQRGTEAALKYLIVAAAATAFLLFGMALVYAELGSMEFAKLAQAATDSAPTPVLTLGLAMIIAGLGFKLSIVPFHMWTPDVYEGAPAPVTAFIATVSKTAVFGLLLRHFALGGSQIPAALSNVLTACAIATMLGGNLLALMQMNVKRILAYSSIAHVGYMLVAFLAGGNDAFGAVTLYLMAYIITTLGAFGVISVRSSRNPEADCDSLADYAGLIRRDPLLGFVFALMLLSLAGIPLTAGFIGKFMIVLVSVKSHLWWLLATLVASSAMGLFYYLRIVIAVCGPARGEQATAQPRASSAAWLGSLALVILVIALIWMGTCPGPLIAGIYPGEM
ncbi:MAG TPA: NADH-quinone oxidoreductase subunit N [Candidatus Hydrogenedentes bacterium]|nr:NADH-quinone oxidoreductase subunit N [Candidatus Hydrogenedentota bacterium]